MKTSTKKETPRKLYEIIRDLIIADTERDALEIATEKAREIIELIAGATPEEKKLLITDLLCTKHTGKMAGMVSLSTSCQLNEGCKARARVAGSICAQCYAQTQLNHYGNQSIKQAIAHIVLTGYSFKAEEIPFINASFFRFEAFSDLQNARQLENYLLICRVNKHMNAAIWTKDSATACAIIREQGKPKNLQVIYSPLFIDKPEHAKFNNMRDVFDKQFTVYTSADTARAQGVNINCGARSCATCLKCYKRNKYDNISEILKKNANK